MEDPLDRLIDDTARTLTATRHPPALRTLVGEQIRRPSQRRERVRLAIAIATPALVIGALSVWTLREPDRAGGVTERSAPPASVVAPPRGSALPRVEQQETRAGAQAAPRPPQRESRYLAEPESIAVDPLAELVPLAAPAPITIGQMEIEPLTLVTVGAGSERQ